MKKLFVYMLCIIGICLTIMSCNDIDNTFEIKFIVDGTTDVINVEMKNQLEVKVPDTLSSRSVLLFAISMFDIALGIWIINYVKNNKFK